MLGGSISPGRKDVVSCRKNFGKTSLLKMKLKSFECRVDFTKVSIVQRCALHASTFKLSHVFQEVCTGVLTDDV